MSEDKSPVPFWLVIFLVVTFCTLLIGGCTCFVVFCFSPENGSDAQHCTTAKGARWIKRPAWNDRSLFLYREWNSMHPERPRAGRSNCKVRV